MGVKHEDLVERVYRELKSNNKFPFVAKHQEYPLEANTDTLGEVDVIAMNPEKGTLSIYEIKSSRNYLKKGKNQLRRARKYYEQFGYETINTFLEYDVNGFRHHEQVK